MGTIATCGPQPVLRNYGDRDTGYDRAAYSADLAAWRACMAAPSPVQPVQAMSSTNPSTNPDGAIADQALVWLPPNLPGGATNSIYQSWRAQIVAALGVGILDPGGQYATRTGKCSGSTPPQGATGVQISQTALGIAGTGATTGLAIAGIAGATVPIVGAAVAAGSILIQLFSKLFGPATSALEQKYLCPLVSSANAVLLQIVSEVNGGQLTAAQAGAAFDSLASQFHAQLITPINFGGQTNELLYYNTPNDSQFMDSSLNALGIKYKRVWYPQLEAAANARKVSQTAAAQQAATAQATALQQQINTDVAAAIAAKTVPAMATSAPVGLAAPAAVSVPTPSTSNGVLYAMLGAVVAVIVLMFFL